MEGLNIKQMLAGVHAIAEEKNLPEDTVLNVIEQAIAAAWKHDHDARDLNVRAILNTENGTAKIIVHYDIVEEPENGGQLSLEDAKKIDKQALLEGVIEQEHEAKSFGRVAAQVAKQVLLQKLREAEREIVAKQFDGRIGEILTGTVARVEPRVVRIDLGKGEGIMPPAEQIPGERLMVGARIKVLLKDIERDQRGATLILSRAAADFVKILFQQEVPEIETGAVEIKAVAREAGKRTKIAVASGVTGVDPVGTFVGAKGVRVQAVMNEIGDMEKIDIVTFDKDTKNFIANALSPAEIQSIDLNEEEKKASVHVDNSQKSIAIGKQGQNVRLASVLTGYELEIVAE
ncbi:MAG: transcription termination factor NusA [Candidatus Nomurabacteria bacterium]|jgi:N utilization substance protein A|nr:transcription termination factor NusA [Candidatus Nomurabacteria bacterium]